MDAVDWLYSGFGICGTKPDGNLVSDGKQKGECWKAYYENHLNHQPISSDINLQHRPSVTTTIGCDKSTRQELPASTSTSQHSLKVTKYFIFWHSVTSDIGRLRKTFTYLLTNWWGPHDISIIWISSVLSLRLQKNLIDSSVTQNFMYTINPSMTSVINNINQWPCSRKWPPPTARWFLWFHRSRQVSRYTTRWTLHDWSTLAACTIQ